MQPAKRDERLYLLDIQEAIERIQNFTKPGKKRFYKSMLVQDAVVKNILIIGEAAKQLSPETRAKAPATLWTGATRTRDRLIHGYYDIDLGIIWNIIEKHLQPLNDAITQLLDESSSE